MTITVDVGKIKLVWRGTYNNSTSYTIDDLVVYDDGSTTSSYICVANTTGNVPSTLGTLNSSYWNISSKGATAASGGTSNNQIQLKSGTGFDADNLFVFDPATNRLGVNTDSPTSTLDVDGLTTTTNLTVTDNFNASGISTFSDTLNVSGVSTFSGNLKFNQFVREKINIIAGTANANTNINLEDGPINLFTSNSSSTWIPNFRASSSTSLDSSMSVGETVTTTLISSQNNTTYYITAVNVDGSSRTVEWSGGTAPTSGSASGYDVYTFSIIKTASNTFIVLASQTQYN